MDKDDEKSDKRGKSVATHIVQSASRHRLWSMIFGYTLSLVLLGGGIWFTQRDFAPRNENPEANIEKSSNYEANRGQLSAQIGVFKFVAKNTAPGLVLILCGTWLATVTVKRKSRAKTQWGDDSHPGFTEVDG